jgi:hypothetical protein
MTQAEQGVRLAAAVPDRGEGVLQVRIPSGWHTETDTNAENAPETTLALTLPTHGHAGGTVVRTLEQQQTNGLGR